VSQQKLRSDIPQGCQAAAPGSQPLNGLLAIRAQAVVGGVSQAAPYAAIGNHNGGILRQRERMPRQAARVQRQRVPRHSERARKLVHQSGLYPNVLVFSFLAELCQLQPRDVPPASCLPGQCKADLNRG